MKNLKLIPAAGPILFMLLTAGCGGGSSSTSPGSNNLPVNNPPPTNGGVTNSAYAGTYQGVYVNTSGPSAPDAGTVALTVSSAGAVTGTSVDYAGDGSAHDFTGTVSSAGTLTTPLLSLSLSANPATHVISSSITEKDGTKGTLSLGLTPTASLFAGSYSGTFSNAVQQLPMTLTISANGVVTGTLGTLAAANQGFTFSGSVDTSGNLYLADKSGGVPENVLGSLTLSGTSLTGTAHGSAADGSSSMGTFSLTKQ